MIEVETDVFAEHAIAKSANVPNSVMFHIGDTLFVLKVIQDWDSRWKHLVQANFVVGSQT